MTLNAGAPVEAGKKQGVYYSLSDHPGLIVRILVDVVDLVVASLLSFVIACLLFMFANDDALLPTMVGIWAAYFVLLKWKWRTLGYWVFDLRLVNLRGKSPAFWSVLVRLLFM